MQLAEVSGIARELKKIKFWKKDDIWKKKFLKKLL